MPHSAKDTSRANTFAFRTPPWYASVLKEAGFDVLSVANNHSMDFFEQGFEDTIANIEASGMKAVGRKGEILVVEAQGQRVAFIAFSTFDVHNTVNDLESAIALVETAQQQADMVVVSFHAGKEGTDAVYTRDQEEFFYSENRGNVVRFSHTMVDHGADLVLGHGPHAPRALELYNNEVTTGAQPGMADEALDVFISYSRQDEALKNELVDYHLKRLQREGKINTWQDRDIEAGAEWAQAIKTNLEKADIVLLLVTHYFLASDYCYETEMQRAVQRHEEGTARVIPIILRPCSWEESEFKKLQVLPTDGKPVTSWTNPEEAFLIVEKGIRQVVDALNGEPIRAVEAARAQATAAINRQQEATERIAQERKAAEQQQQNQAEAQRQEQERLHKAQLAAEQQKQAEAIRVEQKRQQQESRQESSAIPVEQSSLPLKLFEFEVVTLNNQGKETTRTRQQAKYYSEELGDGIWLDMVAIPGGHFLMGSPDGEGDADERPQHRVTVPPFLMGKFSVTQAQWSAVAAMPQVNRRLNPDSSYFKGAMRPVETVSWDDAVEFCQRLSQHTNRLYRLPSEAEWEYACRAGTTTRYSFGDTITGDQVNCNCQKTVVLNEGFLGIGRKEEKSGLYRQKTTEAGSFPPNAFGASITGTTPTTEPPPMGVLGYPLARVIQGCCGVVLGSTIRGTAARPTAAGSRATTSTTTSVFGSSALPRGLFNCPLLFSPLALYTS